MLHLQYPPAPPAAAGGITLIARHGNYNLTGASSGQFALTGITAGATLVACNITTTNRDLISLVDDVNGAWTRQIRVISVNNAHRLELHDLGNSAAGALTVTATYNTSLSGSSSEFWVYELSAGASLFDWDVNDSGSTSLGSHDLVQAAISSAGADAIGVGAFRTNANPSTVTPPDGWEYQAGTHGGNQRHFLYTDPAAPLAGVFPYQLSTARVSASYGALYTA